MEEKMNKIHIENLNVLLKSNIKAQEIMLKEIEDGNTAPRVFEVMAKMQGVQMDIIRQIAAIEQNGK